MSTVVCRNCDGAGFFDTHDSADSEVECSVCGGAGREEDEPVARASPATEPAGGAPRLCAVCGAPATCVGAYEGATDPEPACDGCCGHGNEDGWCEPLA